ncbi:MAG: hypothetical protein M1538_02870 [Candidatus Marsarchaeota archaeon]|jgi:virulence-associated protein VapD|nr:hypothetical protein [Candidatus Marsarchaeota archaeon]
MLREKYENPTSKDPTSNTKNTKMNNNINNNNINNNNNYYGLNTFNPYDAILDAFGINFGDDIYLEEFKKSYNERGVKINFCKETFKHALDIFISFRFTVSYFVHIMDLKYERRSKNLKVINHLQDEVNKLNRQKNVFADDKTKLSGKDLENKINKSKFNEFEGKIFIEYNIISAKTLVASFENLIKQFKLDKEKQDSLNSLLVNFNNSIELLKKSINEGKELKLEDIEDLKNQAQNILNEISEIFYKHSKKIDESIRNAINLAEEIGKSYIMSTKKLNNIISNNEEWAAFVNKTKNSQNIMRKESEADIISNNTENKEASLNPKSNMQKIIEEIENERALYNLSLVYSGEVLKHINSIFSFINEIKNQI